MTWTLGMAMDAMERLVDEQKAEIERQRARIERLVAAFDAFSKATSVSGGPSLTMQRHNQTWEAWKTLCNAFAALAGTEGSQNVALSVSDR